MYINFFWNLYNPNQMLGVFLYITVLELTMWIKTVFLEMKGTQVWHLFPKAEWNIVLCLDCYTLVSVAFWFRYTFFLSRNEFLIRKIEKTLLDLVLSCSRYWFITWSLKKPRGRNQKVRMVLAFHKNKQFWK